MMTISGTLRFVTQYTEMVSRIVLVYVIQELKF